MSTIWKQAAGIALGVVIGLGMGAMMYAKATPKQQAAPEVIRAQRFELVDEQGQVIGEFGVHDIGQDSGHTPEDVRKTLGISGKTVGLYLIPRPNNGVVALTATPEGVGGLVVAGFNAKKNQWDTAAVSIDHETPGVWLSIDGEHHYKKERTIKP